MLLELQINMLSFDLEEDGEEGKNKEEEDKREEAKKIKKQKKKRFGKTSIKAKCQTILLPALFNT